MSHVKLSHITIGADGRPIPVYRVKRNVRQPVGIFIAAVVVIFLVLVALS